MFKRLSILVLAVICIPQLVNADEGKVTFEKDVLPLFKKHCVKCHNASSRKGELDLSDGAALFKAVSYTHLTMQTNREL